MTFSARFNEVRPTTQFSARTVTPSRFVLHGAAMTSLDGLSNMIVNRTRQVSAHGGFKDKRGIGWVDEENRAWSLSDEFWDSIAFTLENANQSVPAYDFTGDTQESIAQWIAEVATRKGIWPHRDGAPKSWTVIGHREVYTIHGGSYATACPQQLDLNWVTARAQQIMNGEPVKEEEDPMQNYTAFGRGFILGQGYLLISDGDNTTAKWKEWYGAPEDFGGKYFEPGKPPASAYGDPAATKLNIVLRAHGITGDWLRWANQPSGVAYREGGVSDVTVQIPDGFADTIVKQVVAALPKKITGTLS